jgi:hypothetical protein
VRRPLGWLAIIALTTATLSLSACRNRRNLAEHIMDDPAHSLASQRCGGAGQIVRPLIIEWPATDRASLEGRLRRGQVIVVRYDGCAVEVMRDCAAPETGYDYIGITRKNDRVAIRTTDELYVNMPLTAVNLEAKLAKAGELNVAMALVGNYEAQRSRFDFSELQGRCDGATHVIAAAQVGAFQF